MSDDTLDGEMCEFLLEYQTMATVGGTGVHLDVFRGVTDILFDVVASSNIDQNGVDVGEGTYEFGCIIVVKIRGLDAPKKKNLLGGNFQLLRRPRSCNAQRVSFV